jgi:hypothetical protein
MRTNADLTIYNKYIDPTTRSEKYQRTQVGKVAWENRKGINVIMSGGSIESDQASIYIPYSLSANYLEAPTWRALADKTGKWTLQVGDILVNGLVTDEITLTATTDPITHVVTPAFTPTSLKAKYNEVLMITALDFMDAGSKPLWHWQVGAK